MTSSAFLSSAACTAPATGLGSLAPPRRTAGFAALLTAAAERAVEDFEAAVALLVFLFARVAVAVFARVRAVPLPVGALLFAMQVVYRSLGILAAPSRRSDVQMMRRDVPRYRRRHQIVD